MSKFLFRRENFPLGILIGFIFGVSAYYVIDGANSENWLRYGTVIVTSLVTITASLIAVAGVLHRVQADKDASLRASKAVLPAALSALYQQARIGYNLAKNAEEIGLLDEKSLREHLEKNRINPRKHKGVKREYSIL